MKSCTNCKHATWQKTKTGRLHPSGDGVCDYPWKLPPLPASMYWIRFNDPTPSGGHINRRHEHKDHCVYFAREDACN
jgi:hypothetical protein